MKIFMNVTLGGKIEVRIIDENKKQEIFLTGEKCSDFMPMYGLLLDKEDEKKLLKWMLERTYTIDCSL